MTDQSRIKLKHDDGRLTIILNRAEAANAIAPDMVEDIISALETAAPKLCVIKAEGPNFCAGFDLSDIDDLSDGDLLWRFVRIETMLQMVHYANFPILALAQGHVVGAGADLFAACSHRIAAPDTKFKMPGWNFELASGTRRLAKRIGPDAARDMLIGRRRVPAPEAKDIGLASDICPQEGWSEEEQALQKHCTSLPEFSRSYMLELTSQDSRDADMAAVVRSAGRPGLKERIKAYQAKVIAERKARKSSG